MARRKSSSPPPLRNVGSATPHPLRAIVELLPGLPVINGAIDFAAADGDLVQTLGDHLDTLIGIAHNGITALGYLVALAAPEIEGGELRSLTIEGLGWLVSELGDVAAWATLMNLVCKQHNADFVPQGGA